MAPSRYTLSYLTDIFDPLAKSAHMRKTSVVIDDELVARVRVLLGTASIRETIDKALREVERGEARRREIRALIEMDGLDLHDPAVMSKAWRY